MAEMIRVFATMQQNADYAGHQDRRAEQHRQRQRTVRPRRQVERRGHGVQRRIGRSSLGARHDEREERQQRAECRHLRHRTEQGEGEQQPQLTAARLRDVTPEAERDRDDAVRRTGVIQPRAAGCAAATVDGRDWRSHTIKGRAPEGERAEEGVEGQAHRVWQPQFDRLSTGVRVAPVPPA